MENKKYPVIFLAIFLTASIPGATFAYGVGTHQGITQTTLKAYEKLHGDLFSIDDEQLITKGSSDEDILPRPVQHFYDPINNRGLTRYSAKFQSSKYWAQDTEAQGDYNCIGSWVCVGDSITFNDKLFSSDTDFSWDRAIYEYAWGDKKRGVETLGHILHLLQDSTVPAHVRNDDHLSGFDPDPYEGYTGKYGLGSVPLLSDIGTVPRYPNIAFALDGTASFTNKHFVSEDTLFKAYSLPTSENLLAKNGYRYDTNLNSRIVKEESIFDPKTNSFNTGWQVNDRLVLSDNWNILSATAIRNGVGVIDLFFREVEEEKKTGTLKARNVSAAELRAIENAKKGFKYVKALYGSSLEQSDVEELLADNVGQAGAAALAVADAPPPQNTVSTKPTASPVSTTKPPQSAPQVLGASVSPVEEPTEQDPPPSVGNDDGDTISIISGGASGGSPTQNADTSSGSGSSPSPSLPALSLSILSPSENELFATTSVTFTGTTSAVSVVTAAYDSTLATTTTGDNGNWTFNLSLSSGTTTVSFSAATSTETTATSTRTVAVDVASPDAPDISINECAASFTAVDCTVAATTVTISWNAVSGATYYDVVKNDVSLATTNATSTTSDIPASATTTFSVVAHKSNGTAATSTEKTVFVITQPLIINEVVWAGTNTYPEDEWIEVKNMTSSTLDLSHFVITDTNGSRVVQLSGMLDPIVVQTGSGYLVVERSAEAVSGVSNVLTSEFAQLSDSGEQLLLQWGDGLATTTVDSTPAVATCGGWCSGASEGSIGYSVQQGTSTMNLTMERKEGSADGSLAASWQTTDAYSFYGNDRSPSAIFGTPGVANSNGYPTVGWFCSPDTFPITSGTHYTPPSESCTYLLRAISTNTNRYTALYRGEVGSSTLEAQDFAGVAYIRQNRTTAISNPQAGELFYIAVYEGRIGPNFDNDPSGFDAYFKTGGAPPHSNYFVIPWVYGP